VDSAPWSRVREVPQSDVSRWAGMAWTWQEIERDWLAGGVLADPPEAIVAAFDRVSDSFGRDWVEGSRFADGVEQRGILATLPIVTLGKLLAVVEPIVGSAKLVEKLKEGRLDAHAEAMALYLLLDGRRDVIAEVEPTVTVGRRQRIPDFRVRRAPEPWTYTEVTRADASEAYLRARAKLDRLLGHTREPTLIPYAIEVFLRREPTDDEITDLQQRIADASRESQRGQFDLPDDLGVIFLSHSPPSQIVLHDHGEPYSPRIGVAAVLAGGDELPRHIAARMSFSDERADEFLRAEARQLPTDAPGLIMINIPGALGAMKGWETLLRARLQPTLHTRVSAVCLFQTGQESIAAGEAVVPHARVIINPHARLPLSPWIRESLGRYEDP
jgi:hypothetical protein